MLMLRIIEFRKALRPFTSHVPTPPSSARPGPCCPQTWSCDQPVACRLGARRCAIILSIRSKQHARSQLCGIGPERASAGRPLASASSACAAAGCASAPLARRAVALRHETPRKPRIVSPVYTLPTHCSSEFCERVWPAVQNWFARDRRSAKDRKLERGASYARRARYDVG
jgi:hypothetical protein